MSFTETQLFLRQQAGLSAKQLKFKHIHCFGGDAPSPTANESMGSVLKAYANNLPYIMRSTGNNIAPFEQQLFDAQSKILPQQDQLQADLYAKYAPVLNQVGQQIQGSNSLAQAQNDSNVVNSQGAKSLVTGALDNQRLADPQFFANQKAIGEGYLKLLGAQDPTRLSGSEAAQTERGLNRLNIGNGNYNPTNNLNTINNAMTFGNALADKQQRYGQTIGLGAQIAPSMRTGIDTFQLTTGKPSMNNPSANQFLGVNQNSFGQQGLGMANQTLGAATQFGLQANDINSQRRDSLDRFNQTLTANAGAVGSVCCFIFLQAYNGRLPQYVRQSRDNTYLRNPRIAKGYIRMAKWLVPLMDRFALVSELVNTLMVKPLSEHAAYLTGEKAASQRIGYCRFWLTLWAHI